MPTFKHLLLVFVCLISVNNAVDLSIADYGAKGDGQTDASRAFINAWAAACESSSAAATIRVPSDKYFVGPVVFQGPRENTRITFRLHGILLAPADYRHLGSSADWISFRNVRGVAVIGGYLDGKGSSMWACKDARNDCPHRASSLAFYDSKDVLIQDLTSINSKNSHIEIHSSEDVTVRGVRIVAPGRSPNTDGIHVQNSTGVNILETDIKTGDDCISIGPGTRNLWIESVACGPGHGISIGSLAKRPEEEGVENVTVKKVVLRQTENGLRIKAWKRASKGYVRGVVFQHVTMINAKNPIIIDQHYCPNHGKDCPNQRSGGVKVSDVAYEDIKGTSASKIAVKFDCSASSPCKHIELHDIMLTYGKPRARSFCQNVKGTASGLVEPPSCL
ncbi:hypothetical protein ACLOJK_011652 [Asimina triloba]